MSESSKTTGNKLGHFIKISNVTLKGKYTSFAQICVEMDLSGALLNAIILEVYDKEWVQVVDYDHVPFRCRKCHEHGHLFKDFPSNKMENCIKATSGKDTKVFNKVGGKRKGGRKN